MNKQKPHKGMRKRVKVTARKKITFKKAFSGHLMSGKSGRRCQRLRQKGVLTGKLLDNVLRSLCED